MKTIQVYQCEICARQSASYEEIEKCEARHLGVTIEELYIYGELRQQVRAWKHLLERNGAEDAEKGLEEAMNKLAEFEKKHGLN